MNSGEKVFKKTTARTNVKTKCLSVEGLNSIDKELRACCSL